MTSRLCWAAFTLIVVAIPNAQAQVLSGIDVLVREGFASLDGARVGLITNQTGTDFRGTSTVQRMQQATNLELVALFSPEHGFTGTLDQATIEDSQDDSSGLRIYSLYGETRVPTTDMLEGIDTLVFDIQDIGTRFYTYISTMGGAMRAAADHGLKFVVLDRPNPIDGVTVQGPVLDAGSESFVGYHPIAVRHGMTVGELASMFRGEWNLQLDLQVIPVEGWQPTTMFDQFGRLWINPSPNMRSLTQALLYPGVGLLETTNLSVGRGTDTPFEMLGAPWIDPLVFAQELRNAQLPGISWVPVRFTPAASKYQGEVCGGVQLIITDRQTFDPLRTGLTLAVTLRRLYRDQWDTTSLNRLLANRRCHDGILAGQNVTQLQSESEAELTVFRQRRARYLLYPRAQ